MNEHLVPNLKKKLISGGGWALSGRLSMLSIGFVSNALLARLLTPEELGVYFLLLSIVSVGAVIGLLGLEQTIVRFVASYISLGKLASAKRAVWLIFRLAFIGILVISVALNAGGGAWLSRYVFSSNAMANVISLATIWLIIVAVQRIMSECFRGFYDIRMAVALNGLIAGAISMIVFALLFVWAEEAHLEHVISIIVLSGSIAVVFGVVSLYKKWQGMSNVTMPSNDMLNSVELLKISTPLLITYITSFSITQIDLWIIAANLPSENAAIYGAASRVAQLLIVPMAIIDAVIPPIVAELYTKNNNHTLGRLMKVVSGISGIPAIFGFLFLVLFGNPILIFIYGDYYSQGYEILLILGMGQLAIVLTGSCAVVLMMTGRQNLIMAINVFFSVVIIFLSIYIVKAYGAIGVAIATSLVLLLQNVVMMVSVRKTIGIWTYIGLQEAYTALLRQKLA